MQKYCSRCKTYHDINTRCKAQRITKPVDTEQRAFRSSRAWTNKSIEIRERDKFLCRACLADGVINYEGLEVHHIIPLAEDSSKGLDNDNLITLCVEHHKQAESGEISKEVLRYLLQDIPPVGGDFTFLKRL